jgi:hypothetical protein
MQSAFDVQLVRQALLVPHTYGMQLDVGGAAQLPVPLQLETADSVEPVQVWVPHETAVDASAHAPDPSHKPVLPQGGAGVHAASALPAVTFAQAPKLPATLHDWQVGQLATPQQIPSVQNPEAHSFALPHTAPVGFLVKQLPPAPLQ